MALDQLYFARPMPLHSSYRCPLHGLYLCGSGAHPGEWPSVPQWYGAPGRTSRAQWPLAGQPPPVSSHHLLLRFEHVSQNLRDLLKLQFGDLKEPSLKSPLHILDQ